MKREMRAVLTVLFLMMLLWAVSCAYQRSVSLPPIGLPENIFVEPHHNIYQGAKVAVYSFGEPTYAPGQGRAAAHFLSQELEKSNFFSAVVMQPDLLDMTMENLIMSARNKGYEILIVGDLLYSFTGSDLEPTEVKEEIRIIRIRGGTPLTLWYARATETVSPALTKDYVLARGSGASAPSTELLMQRNARKFCNMIAGSSDDSLTETPDLPE
jgi:hypothetical protein